MHLSQRGKNVPASPIRRLVPFADQAKQSGAGVYHLNIGQPDIPTPPEMLHAYRSFKEPVLAYGPSAGLPILKQEIARYWSLWNVEVSPEEIVITTGGSEAILFALLATCDPGDEVLVPEPFYANYLGFASAAGIQVKPIPCSVSDGFRLPDADLIRSLVTPKTRAFLFCNPGNPTGVVYTKEEVQTLATLASETGLFLLADEVYREFVYDGMEFTSAFHLEGLDEQIVILDSISKRYSACGARVGYLATRNKAIIEAATRYGQARLCPATIDQLAAAAGFASHEKHIDAVIEEYEERRNVLYRSLQEIPGVETHRPQGAFYTIAKLPLQDAETFATWMLTDFRVDGETVMVAPASGFYATPGVGLDEVRIAYVLNQTALVKAMSILHAGINAFNAR